MEKIDYRKRYHWLYSPASSHASEVMVPPMQFAMIDGKGTPEGPEMSPEFQSAVQALYGVTYTLKFGRKKAGLSPDYTVGPLEGLWWMSSGAEFDMSRPGDWCWTLMIFQPEFISADDFARALSELKKKRPSPALDQLRLEAFDEGLAVQIMHVGPYDQERQDIQKLEDYAAEHGYAFSGKHHEIYLGDPRRAKPDRLKTILRHPVVIGGTLTPEGGSV